TAADEREIPAGVCGGKIAKRRETLLLDEAADEQQLAARVLHLKALAQSRPLAVRRGTKQLVIDTVEEQRRLLRPSRARKEAPDRVADEHRLRRSCEERACNETVCRRHRQPQQRIAIRNGADVLDQQPRLAMPP